jgi:hypothetical protein
MEVRELSVPQERGHGQCRRRCHLCHRRLDDLRQLHRPAEPGRLPGSGRQGHVPQRRRLPRRPDRVGPGDRHALARCPGRTRGAVRAAFRVRRDPALFRRGCENPLPGQRRQHLDAAGRRRVSLGHDTGHAIGRHSATARTRLRRQALRPERRVAGAGQLHLPRQPSTRRTRRHQADGRLVLLHGLATGQSGGPDHRSVACRPPWPTSTRSSRTTMHR